jgi:hypothetical protein
MHPSPAKSLAGHRIKGSASFVVLPGSHIDQDKSIPPASNCINHKEAYHVDFSLDNLDYTSRMHI